MLICQEIDNQEMRTCEIKSRKVAKCIEMLFFPCLVALEAQKVSSLKRRVRRDQLEKLRQK